MPCRVPVSVGIRHARMRHPRPGAVGIIAAEKPATVAVVSVARADPDHHGLTMTPRGGGVKTDAPETGTFGDWWPLDLRAYIGGFDRTRWHDAPFPSVGSGRTPGRQRHPEGTT